MPKLIILMAVVSEKEKQLLNQVRSIVLNTFSIEQILFLESYKFKAETIIIALFFWIGLNIITFEQGLEHQRKCFRKRLKDTVTEAALYRKDNNIMSTNGSNVSDFLLF